MAPASKMDETAFEAAARGIHDIGRSVPDSILNKPDR
jgi:hypothetical protein